MTTNPIAPRSTGFDAGADELHFNFEPYVKGAKGVIPEPSTEQIGKLLTMLKEVMPITTDENGKATLDIAKLTEKFADATGEEVEAIVNVALSEVCSGTPTPEQIAALPYRVKQRFYGWILGTFLAPEA